MQYLLLTLNVSANTPVKSLDVIMNVPASPACSWPVETRWPDVLTCSIYRSDKNYVQ